MEIFVFEADIDSYPLPKSYVLSFNKTYNGAIKALNEFGSQKWIEREDLKDEKYRYFEPDFVPNDNKQPPLESARIYTVELKD